MRHIDDWLDKFEPKTDGERFAFHWFDHFRRPSIQHTDQTLDRTPLFCTYKDGKRYRCIGASRMGDVWLTADHSKRYGYDLRIDIDDCRDWSGTP